MERVMTRRFIAVLWSNAPGIFSMVRKVWESTR